MTRERLEKLFDDNAFPHTSGSKEELKVAEYLKACCEEMGVPAHLESFPVDAADISEAVLTADGAEIPCKALAGCGSGEIEGELYYLPAVKPAFLAGAKDKIVLVQEQYLTPFMYDDLLKAGAKALICQYGNLFYPNDDIDQRSLRLQTQSIAGEKVLCVMVNVASAVAMQKNHVKNVKIRIKQDEYQTDSHNVVADIPGTGDEYIILSAHYDSTSLSTGAYDNLSGCAGLLGVMDALKDTPHHYGLKFIFCGSEEIGLVGSEAYAEAHKDELDKAVLNINLDMIGSILGKFNFCATAEDAVRHYAYYLGCELGFPVFTWSGVYGSDSTSFADKGVPAVTMARSAGGPGGNLSAPIHCRYDTKDVLSFDQLEADTAFITEFTRRMADAVICPVSRKFPEKIKKGIDEYKYRVRPEED